MPTSLFRYINQFNGILGFRANLCNQLSSEMLLTQSKLYESTVNLQSDILYFWLFKDFRNLMFQCKHIVNLVWAETELWNRPALHFYGFTWTQFTLGGHLLFDLDACTCTVQFVSVFLITFMLPNCLLPVVKFVMNENGPYLPWVQTWGYK